MSMSKYTYTPILWLRYQGNFLLGAGRAEMLRIINETGSLRETAKKMNISYRHLWNNIQKINNILHTPIVRSIRGGEGGGKTVLTEIGKKILNEYEFRRNMMNRVVKYPSPSLAVDGIILLNGKIVLIKRKNEPYKSFYALPGGFVRYNEMVENAIIREIKEETGLITKIKNLIGVYSSPNRDPRGHTVSIVFALKKVSGKLHADSDASDIGLFSVKALPELAFDHRKIIEDYILTLQAGEVVRW